MISVMSVKVDDETCLGVRVELPGSPPLLLVVAERGFVMCGFLDVDVAERLGVAAAVVSGVVWYFVAERLFSCHYFLSC